MTSTLVLHQQVAEVCPILGVSGPFAPPASQYSFSTLPAVDGSLWVIDYDPSATAAQKTAAQNTVAAFDPAGPLVTGQTTYDAAIGAGITLTWTTTTALNGTYAIDPTTMSKVNIEYAQLNINNTFPSGTALKPWSDMAGNKHIFSPPNFKLFAAALNKYTSQLGEALANSLNNQTATWPPANVSISA